MMKEYKEALEKHFKRLAEISSDIKQIAKDLRESIPNSEDIQKVNDVVDKAIKEAKQ